jgi:hypothetical protein
MMTMRHFQLAQEKKEEEENKLIIPPPSPLTSSSSSVGAGRGGLGVRKRKQQPLFLWQPQPDLPLLPFFLVLLVFLDVEERELRKGIASLMSFVTS